MNHNHINNIKSRRDHTNSKSLSSVAITYLLHAAILLTPFQDLDLPGGFGGTFLRSAASVPMFGIAFLMIKNWQVRQFAPLRILWIAGVSIATIYYLIYFDFQFLGQSLILKAVNTLIFILVFFLPAGIIRHDLEKFRVSFLVAFLTLIFAYIFGDVLELRLFSETGIFHSFPNFQQRPRGFALEASVFSTQVIVLGAICASLARSQWIAIFQLLVTSAIALNVGSKGGVGAGLLAVGFATLFILPRRPIVGVTLAVIGGVGSVILSGTLTELAKLSFSGGTSFTTRLTLLYSAVSIVLTNPLGVGLGAMAPKLQQTVFEALPVLTQFLDTPLKTDEIYNLMMRATTDRYLTTKIGLWDFAILTGIPGLFYFLKLFIKPLMKASTLPLPLMFGLFFSLFALSMYVPFNGCYHFTLLLIVANSFSSITSSKNQTN